LGGGGAGPAGAGDPLPTHVGGSGFVATVPKQNGKTHWPVVELPGPGAWVPGTE
jgi:hypothetical protein